MSKAEKKDPSDTAASAASGAQAARSKWWGWRLVASVGVIAVIVTQGLKRFMPGGKRTAGEAREAEKERQKAIRRELRGLPAVHDNSVKSPPTT